MLVSRSCPSYTSVHTPSSQPVLPKLERALAGSGFWQHLSLHSLSGWESAEPSTLSPYFPLAGAILGDSELFSLLRAVLVRFLLKY